MGTDGLGGEQRLLSDLIPNPDNKMTSCFLLPKR